MRTVYVTDPIAEKVLTSAQAKYKIYCGYGPEAVPWKEVSAQIDAAIVRTSTITESMIRSAPQLRIIARHGVGYDNVDMEAARRAGIWVTITPGGNATAVAEHVYALLLTTARKTVEAAERVRSGQWTEAKPALLGTQLSGKTVGIIGYGQIGRQVARIAHGFNMHVAVFDPALDPSSPQFSDVTFMAIEALLRQSDVVTLHVPLLPTTRHLLDKRRLSLIRTGGILINTSRGGLIDEQALEKEVKSGRLRCGLDVLEAEATAPESPQETFTSDLRLPGLLITPHIAGQTDQSMVDVGLAALKCVDQALAGSQPDHAVNADDNLSPPLNINDERRPLIPANPPS